MRKPKFVGSVALTLAFAFAPSAFAAKATKSEEAAKTDAKKAEAEAKEAKAEAKEAKAEAKEAKAEVAEAKAEEPKAPPVPPGRLSMRGAATLGSGMAMRAQLGASTAQNLNQGLIQLEYGMLFGLSEHFDIGFNLRAPLYSLGLSPGLSMRWAFINDQHFHLALVGNLQVPMLYAPGFSVGLSVEPGVAMSYFFNENVELFSALMFVWSPIFRSPWVPGSSNAGFAGVFRLGWAYQLTGSNLGFFANFDLSAGYEPIRRFILIGERGTGMAYNAGFTVGAQYRF